ncbi:MAG TPA: hypothetical protein VE176_01425 [Candidatus Limnocylindrales bacterium]|nr:hypothetical protein [Candidatus Limnocylindrales bacterium]
MSGRLVVDTKAITARLSSRQFACVMTLQAAAGMRVQSLMRALVRIKTVLPALVRVETMLRALVRVETVLRRLLIRV